MQQQQQTHYVDTINNFIKMLPDMYFRNYHHREDALLDVEKLKLMGMTHSVQLELPIWGCNANLRIGIARQEGIVSVDDVSISWSSTGRSIGSATAVLGFYQDILKIGAMIEAFVDGIEVIEDIEDIPTINEEDMTKLLAASRFEVDYSDDTTGGYDEPEEARVLANEKCKRVAFPGQQMYAKTVRAYDKDDAQICNFDVGWFFSFKLEELHAAAKAD